MPNKIVSKKQYRFMEAIKNGWRPRGGKGPSAAVAAELLSTQKKSYKKLPAKKRGRKSA